MSWSMNRGQSFNTTLPGFSYPKLSGFSQRFMLSQNDNRMTPGKSEPHLPTETTKGTFKLKKATRKQKRTRCKDLVMPNKKNPALIVGEPKKKRRK